VIGPTGVVKGLLYTQDDDIGNMDWTGSVSNYGQLTGWVLAIEQPPFSLAGPMRLQGTTLSGTLRMGFKGAVYVVQLTATKQ